MKKTLYILAFATCLVACSKSSQTGHIQFQNNSGDTAFQAVIDGKVKTNVQPNSSQTFDVSPGYHQVAAEQVSYYGIVTLITSKLDVVADQTALFIFP